MDPIDKTIFEEVAATDSGEIRIDSQGLPTTLTYHHSIQGKLTKVYQTRKQLEGFLQKFDIIAYKQHEDGSFRIMVQLKRRCGNCDFFERLSLHGGRCDYERFPAVRLDNEDGKDGFYAQYPSVDYGEDCNYHRRNGRFIIPLGVHNVL